MAKLCKLFEQIMCRFKRDKIQEEIVKKIKKSGIITDIELASYFGMGSRTFHQTIKASNLKDKYYIIGQDTRTNREENFGRGIDPYNNMSILFLVQDTDKYILYKDDIQDLEIIFPQFGDKIQQLLKSL